MHSLDHLARLDGVGQAELVARKELTARDLIDACERRLAFVNPLMRAVVSTDFAAARSRAETGLSGPFAGVPFLFKDMCPYPKQRCSFGARLSGSYVPAESSPYTERADGAGLITVGKSATSELGLLGSTETLLEGVTHNPWDLTLSAAGSSGGAAAAVAAGIVPFAHANDGGGSSRIPASVTGLFGLKPSRGRSVASNVISSPLDYLVSDGCISRSVRDSALFLSVVEADGPWPRLGYVRGPRREKLRIGYTTRTLIGSEPDPECARALEASVALCRELGHTLDPAALPDIDGRAVGRAYFTVAGATLSGFMGQLEVKLGRRVGSRDLEPVTLELMARARVALEQGFDVQRTLQVATQRYLEALAPFDLLLTPTLATPPWQLGHMSPLLGVEEVMARTEAAVCYTPIHNPAGCPGMSVPLYWTPAGVPIGSHFAAAPGREDLLLGLAYELEAARPWAERWAPYSFVRLAGA